MKTEFQILVLTIVLIGCGQINDNLNDRRIVTKYKVLDEVTSPLNTNCENEVKTFENMDLNDCSFTLDNQEFDILEKIPLKDNGDVNEYWIYKSEGPLIYTKEDLTRDQGLFELLNIDRLNVRLLGDKKIIDTGDTLEIEKIVQNVIIATRNQEMTDSRVRYLYELNRN